MQDYIWIVITDEILEKANRLKEANYSGSWTNGDGAIFGALGEVCFETVFPEYERKNTTDYDFMHRVTGTRVEVKSKHVADFPQLHFSASVADNYRQVCDYYVFARVRKPLDVCWLIGMYPAKQYFDGAMFHRKGELRCSGGVYPFSCFNRKHSELVPFPRRGIGGYCRNLS